MSVPRIALALAVVALGGCAETTSSPQPRPASVTAPAPSRHVVAVLSLEATGTRVIGKRLVDGPMQIDRMPGRDEWRVEIADADGAVLHTASVRPVGKVRGEFEGPDGKLVHHEIEDPQPVLTLRLPVLPHAASVRLLDVRELWDEQGKMTEREPATLAELKWSEVMP